NGDDLHARQPGEGDRRQAEALHAWRFGSSRGRRRQEGLHLHGPRETVRPVWQRRRERRRDWRKCRASTRRCGRQGRPVSALLEPFGYGYMTNAMWVSALVGGVCAFLSAYLMLKGWSLIGDALSHSVVPGVAAAYIM